MPQRMLITGGLGYIGSSLVKFLQGKKYHVAVLLRESETWDLPYDVEVRKGDLLSGDFLHSACVDIDVVYHLAGKKGYQRDSGSIESVLEANIGFTSRLLGALAGRDARFVFASTYWVYGHRCPLPYSEESEISPSDPYGWTKAIAEKIVEDSGIDFRIVRLGNVFGYGAGLKYGEVASVFIERALRRLPVMLSNGGLQKIDLLSVEEACSVLEKLAGIEEGGFTVNVGSGRPVSVSELAFIIGGIAKKMSGWELEIGQGPAGKNEIEFADRYVDTGRLADICGFKAEPLEKSLERYYLTLKEHLLQ